MRSENPEPRHPPSESGSNALPGPSLRTPHSALRAPLIVVSGPSGVGKTTVVDELLRQTTVPLRRAVTATTRPMRDGEVPGVSYHYWTREDFDQAIRDGRMFEWANVFGTDRYGTPRNEVEPFRAAGVGVILVIDVQGAARVRELAPDCLSVFIRPPSFEELESRLRGRGDMSEERVRRRLDTAREELGRAGDFDYEIINDRLPAAVAELQRLIGTRNTA